MKITKPSMDDNYTPWSGPTPPLAHKQHENVVSPTEPHKMRKPLLTSSLANLRLNAEAILKKLGAVYLRTHTLSSHFVKMC